MFGTSGAKNRGSKSSIDTLAARTYPPDGRPEEAVSSSCQNAYGGADLAPGKVNLSNTDQWFD
jgi:hypothetical protein